MNATELILCFPAAKTLPAMQPPIGSPSTNVPPPGAGDKSREYGHLGELSAAGLSLFT